MVRMWTIHPRFLDRKGLGGQWREAIQCKAILEENRLNGGHVSHPQLDRFRLPLNILGPHENYHFNYFLHTIYSEGRHIRGYNYNIDFVGRHNPIGCFDCCDAYLNGTILTPNIKAVATATTRSTTTSSAITTNIPIVNTTNTQYTTIHAVQPLNLSHTPTTYHLDKPWYYTTERYRMSLPYQDTIVRDNIYNGFGAYSHWDGTLYPLLLQTPRNLVEYSSLISLPGGADSTGSVIGAGLSTNIKSKAKSIASSTASKTKDNNLLPSKKSPKLIAGEDTATKILKLEPIIFEPVKLTHLKQSNGAGGRNANFFNLILPHPTQKNSIVTTGMVYPTSESGALQPTLHSFELQHGIKPLWEIAPSMNKADIYTKYNRILDIHYPHPNVLGETSSNVTATGSKKSKAISKVGKNNNTNDVVVINNISHPYNEFLTPPPTSSNSMTQALIESNQAKRMSILQQWEQMPVSYKAIPVTLGQVLYEWKHLLTRLSNDGRDPEQAKMLSNIYIDINYKNNNQINGGVNNSRPNDKTQNGMYTPTIINFTQDYEVNENETVTATTSTTPTKVKRGKAKATINNDDDNAVVSGSIPSHYNNLPNFMNNYTTEADFDGDLPIIYEKHPYVTQFKDYGLPDWCNVHSPNHEVASKEFNNVPETLSKMKGLDQTIPGYNQNDVLLSEHNKKKHGWFMPKDGVESDDNNSNNNNDQDSDSSIDDDDMIDITTTVNTLNKKNGVVKKKKTIRMVDDDEDEYKYEDEEENTSQDESDAMVDSKSSSSRKNKATSPKRKSSSSTTKSQKKPPALTRKPSSDSDLELTTSSNSRTGKPRSSLFQIRPVAQLPADCTKVLHINDLLNPLFYIVDGEIEYMEVLGDHDLGELKLFNGM